MTAAPAAKLDTLKMTQQFLAAEYDEFCMAAGGWLCDVLVETNVDSMWYKNDVRCELTDTDSFALYGQFTINAGSGYHCGGIRLAEPLPNMDTRFPYVLRLLDEHPRVRITVVHAWP